MQRDALILVPQEIDDEPITVKTRRVKSGREQYEDLAKQRSSAICRSQYRENGQAVDNGALTLFHTYWGRLFEADEMYICMIRRMTIGAVAHIDDAVILRSSFVFELSSSPSSP